MKRFKEEERSCYEGARAARHRERIAELEQRGEAAKAKAEARAENRDEKWCRAGQGCGRGRHEGEEIPARRRRTPGRKSLTRRRTRRNSGGGRACGNLDGRARGGQGGRGVIRRSQVSDIIPSYRRWFFVAVEVLTRQRAKGLRPPLLRRRRRGERIVGRLRRQCRRPNPYPRSSRLLRLLLRLKQRVDEGAHGRSPGGRLGAGAAKDRHTAPPPFQLPRWGNSSPVGASRPPAASTRGDAGGGGERVVHLRGGRRGARAVQGVSARDPGCLRCRPP